MSTDLPINIGSISYDFGQVSKLSEPLFSLYKMGINVSAPVGLL